MQIVNKNFDTVLEGFAYPCETGYADFVRVYGTAHLKHGCKMSLNLRHEALKCQRSGGQCCTKGTGVFQKY